MYVSLRYWSRRARPTCNPAPPSRTSGRTVRSTSPGNTGDQTSCCRTNPTIRPTTPVPAPHEQADTQALEHFTLPPDRDVHRRDLGALERPHATGKLELDDECFVGGFLNGPNGLIQSEGRSGDAHPTSLADRRGHLTDHRRHVSRRAPHRL